MEFVNPCGNQDFPSKDSSLRARICMCRQQMSNAPLFMFLYLHLLTLKCSGVSARPSSIPVAMATCSQLSAREEAKDSDFSALIQCALPLPTPCNGAYHGDCLGCIFVPVMEGYSKCAEC